MLPVIRENYVGLSMGIIYRLLMSVYAYTRMHTSIQSCTSVLQQQQGHLLVPEKSRNETGEDTAGARLTDFHSTPLGLGWILCLLLLLCGPDELLFTSTVKKSAAT